MIFLGSRSTRGRGAPVSPPHESGEEEEEEEEPEKSSDSKDVDPSYGPEEVCPSQLLDAPTPTQASPPRKRQATTRDRAYVLSANKLPTDLGRQRRKKKLFTPAPSVKK